ncbi:hypothetical protein EW146_g9582 [Bondarzewia mesenterica]|uniref:G-patch domain-containing protein n=1 Tax=Bondarzewia mesenterica TaxID=1095465 RepID=A0A4V3XCN3_9AGAM|nr:hypothetical protein EW146_g9582 [Bondarzewia mesenterica]
MEEGEISDILPASGYDPTYEWPGEETPLPQIQPSASSRVPLRLVVQNSSILARKLRLAIIDGYSEVQFGRDVAQPGTETPRIRLKEMEVSKLHATAFWDAGRKEWALVDMGSMHGTFVKSQSTSSGGTAMAAAPHNGVGEVDRRGIRLSMPRVASVPRRLKHLDRVTIGSTTFVAHLHENRLPCVECSASAEEVGDEIPLFDLKTKQREEVRLTKKRKREANFVEEERTAGGRDVKKALTSLKRDLLSRSGYVSPSASQQPTEGTVLNSARYVDRSARRRALHSSSAPDSPGLPSTPTTSIMTPLRQKDNDTMSAPVTPRPTPPAPLTETNVGHKLLAKQGWQPGTALGLLDADSDDARRRLVEPLEVSALAPRAGLGMAGQPSVRSTSTATQRRWDDLHRK